MKKNFDTRSLERKLLLKSETLRHLDLATVRGGQGEAENDPEALCSLVASCKDSCQPCTFTYSG